MGFYQTLKKGLHALTGQQAAFKDVVHSPDNPSKINADVLCTEFATREARQFIAIMGVLPEPDPVLSKLPDRGLSILQEITGDGHLESVIETRQSATLARDFRWEPGRLDQQDEASPEAAKLTAWLAEDLELSNLPEIIAQIIDAPLYGNIPIELMWEQGRGHYVLKEIRPLPTSWFAYNQENKPVFLDKSNTWAGLELPENKFVFARHKPTYSNPYGKRLLSRCVWPYIFKKNGYEFWVKFCERFGIPLVIGTYPQTPKIDEATAQKMLAALSRILQDAVALVPEGSTVRVESGGTVSNAGAIHKELITACEATMSKVIMGQTLTAEIGEVGSYGASKVHKDILGFYQDRDAKLIKTALDEIAWTYAKVNAPNVPAPVFTWQESEDFQVDRVARDEKLSSIITASGLRFSRKYFEVNYRFGPDDIEEAPATPEPAMGYGFSQDTRKHKAFAQSADLGQDALDLVIGEAESHIEPDPALAELIAQAGSEEELIELLLAKAGQMDKADWHEYLERALVAAELAGRWSEEVSHG